MSKERASQQTIPTMSVGTPKTGSIGEKAGPAGETSKGILMHDRIAQLAYNFYEKRGRQEGRALAAWLNAELRLIGVVGQS